MKKWKFAFFITYSNFNEKTPFFTFPTFDTQTLSMEQIFTASEIKLYSYDRTFKWNMYCKDWVFSNQQYRVLSCLCTTEQCRLYGIYQHVSMLLKTVNSHLNKGYNLCTKHSLMVMNQNKEGGPCGRCAHLWISIHCKTVCSQGLHHLAFLSLETGNFSWFYYFWPNKKFLIKGTTWFQMFVYLFQWGCKNA